MRRSTGHLAASASLGAPGALTAALLWLAALPGCLGDVPMHDSGIRSGADLGPTDLVHPRKDYPNGVIRLSNNYVTIRPGQSVSFASHVACPAGAAPCAIRWDFGDGRTSTVQDPGKLAFAKAGFYTVTLTVTDRLGHRDPTPSRAYITVWSGAFSDSFNRAALLPDQHGWRPPLLVSDEGAMYETQGNWLRVTGSWGLPGSTALLAWPEVRNCRVEVIKRRQAETAEHYVDIVLRQHPAGGISQFYRVRVWEEYDAKTGADGIELAIFKVRDSSDEHGILLNDPSQPPGKLPTNCALCPFLDSYPRIKSFKIIVEAWEGQIAASIEDPAKPGVPLLTTTTTDTLDQAYLWAGAVGLTHFEGISFFDDFSVKELTAKPLPFPVDAAVTPTDGGP